ncbi:MAG: hypothetical protein J5I98_30910 [Phaeodactylibacter sp.]|nr:hypothetical protein [Phaeodactylibacter sp.]
MGQEKILHPDEGLEVENSEGYSNLLEDVADSYFIQEEEEQLRKEEKLELDYYFDSFDVINMLQGAMAYETGFRFDRDALKREKRKNSVYALAFQKFFKGIRMLPPHRLEFIRKLDKSHAFFKVPDNRQEYERLYEEVLHALKLGDQKTIRELDSSNIDEFTEKLLQDGAKLFRANYLLREYTWARRFKYLIKEKILVLDQPARQLAEVDDPGLLNLIRGVFDKIRPGYPTNNHYDALAFYYLQEQLNAFKNSKATKKTLPVFYASSPVIKEAISDIRSINPELFAYSSGDKLIPVVRDSLFFVLEAVFTLEDHTSEFFSDLQKAKEDLRALVQKEYEKSFDTDEAVVTSIEHARKQFEEKVLEIINVKFVQEIWIKEKAYQQLVDELKSIFVFKDSDLPIVEERIQETLDETLANAKINLTNSRKLSAIIDNFQNVSKDIDNCLGNVPSSDVFLDFALMKFGLDRRKLPQLQDKVDSLIDFKQVHADYSPVIYEVISSLMMQPDDKEKAKKFLSALTVAWLLNKHELIVALCSDLNREDLRKRYETALIYGASHITINRNKQGIKRTEEIIDCVLSHTDENYKVWLGVGFLYFRLWESKTSLKPDLPEMFLDAWKNQRKSRDYKKYVLHGAIKYATKAYEFLKSEKGNEGHKDKFRLQNYLYALNNVIYYTTKTASREEFKALDPLVSELEGYEGRPEWQGRFYDTLGWYYLREFLLIQDEQLRNQCLEEAERNYQAAMKLGAPPRESILYKQLNRAIIRVKKGSKENE